MLCDPVRGCSGWLCCHRSIYQSHPLADLGQRTPPSWILQQQKQEKVKVISKKVCPVLWIDARALSLLRRPAMHHLASIVPSLPTFCPQAYRELKKKQQGLLSLKAEGAEVATEEVEPNAPLYCFCRRVGSNSMIGCDNEDCEFEWFHWECVGIVTPPTGKWYCKDCRVLLGMEDKAEDGKAEEAGAEGGAPASRPGAGAGAGAGEGAAAPSEPPAASSAAEGGGEGGQKTEGEEMEVVVEEGKEAAAAAQEA